MKIITDVQQAIDRMAEKGYQPTAESRDALRAYKAGYNLWLSGQVGTGKTEFFKNAPWNIPDTGDSNRPRRIIVDMATEFYGMSQDGILEFLHENRINEIVLDDVGNEGTINEYGNRREILPFILSKRMNVKPCTHITTNRDEQYFVSRYGYGFFDRLQAFAYQVKFIGESRRILKPHLV